MKICNRNVINYLVLCVAYGTYLDVCIDIEHNVLCDIELAYYVLGRLYVTHSPSTTT